MSELERLIQELCPNGVPYQPLNTICDVYDGTHQTPKYTDSGIKFASVENIFNPYATKKYISVLDYEKYKIKPQRNDLLMTRIGSIGVCTVIESDEPLAYYVSLALLRPNQDVLNSKYLKYVIESLHCRKELRKRTLVNAVPIKINMGDIGKITLPVPPIEVQGEIVRILDNFTELTAELTADLTADLTARKKQYYHYRRTLIENASGLQSFSLGDLATIKTGNKPENILETKTDYEYINAGTSNSGYTEGFNCSGDTVTTPSRGQGGIGFVGYQKTPFWLGPLCYRIQSKNTNVVINRYLYYYLTCFNEKILAFKKEGGTPAVNASDLLGIDIVVPPIAEQERIVDILDRFDTIYNDIFIGLPAEIEARQKQYEYYRDKLLTFKENEQSK